MQVAVIRYSLAGEVAYAALIYVLSPPVGPVTERRKMTVTKVTMIFVLGAALPLPLTRIAVKKSSGQVPRTSVNIANGGGGGNALSLFLLLQ